MVRVSREKLSFIMDSQVRLWRKPCVQPGRISSLKFKDTVPEGGSSPQMVERRNTHFHVDPCVHDEALLFGANGTC